MRTTARAIVVRDDHLLVMHRQKFGQEFYALVGGALEIGESAEEALLREVLEEASLRVDNPRLVIIEDAGEMYGIQYIFLCDYTGGEPQLSPDSIEAKISADGKNTYVPEWLSIRDLPTTHFLPQELADLLMQCFRDGFPSEPISLRVRL